MQLAFASSTAWPVVLGQQWEQEDKLEWLGQQSPGGPKGIDWGGEWQAGKLKHSCNHKAGCQIPKF